MDGKCPQSHPQRLPALLFKTIWDTYAYRDLQGEFIISNRDPTGKLDQLRCGRIVDIT